MNFSLTRHARTRMCQRAIPKDVLILLLHLGASSSATAGAFRIWFDRDARDDARRAAVEKTARRDIECWFGVGAIVSAEGNVITAQWRTRS